jgi:hypothetical protein
MQNALRFCRIISIIIEFLCHRLSVSIGNFLITTTSMDMSSGYNVSWQVAELEETRGLLNKMEKELERALSNLDWQSETIDHLLQTQLNHGRSKANSITSLLKETASADKL